MCSGNRSGEISGGVSEDVALEVCTIRGSIPPESLISKLPLQKIHTT